MLIIADLPAPNGKDRHKIKTADNEFVDSIRSVPIYIAAPSVDKIFGKKMKKLSKTSVQVSAIIVMSLFHVANLIFQII